MVAWNEVDLDGRQIDAVDPGLVCRQPLMSRKLERETIAPMSGLLYAGGALPILWGTSHLYPTRKVVDGFGRIGRDNRLILTMEWIAEAILLIFTGVLVIVMTARFGPDSTATRTTATISAAMLLVLAAVSAATGGRLHFIMYRLCAPVFTLSAALIVAGAFVA